MSDATFQDGAEQPLAVLVADQEDLGVVSAVLQDAVLSATDMRYVAKRREFCLLVNRFRWEDRIASEVRGSRYERVRTLLIVRDVLSVRSQGLQQHADDTVLSLLSISFTPAEDGTGTVHFVLAGDGLVDLEVEALNATARDVTRPYLAPSRHAPQHG